MKTVISLLIGWLLRAALVLAGIVFFVCLLIVAALLLALWGVRALWARITGHPVAPWVFRVDPRARWGRFSQSMQSTQSSRPGRSAPADRDDVIDVVPREIKPVDAPVDRNR